LHEQEEKLCPHIHMPLQAGSDPVLKKMFRWYTVDQYKWFVDNIRALKRPISITTDIIIWFSDETEEDFQWSLDLIRYSAFDMIFMGIYSPRPGTLWAKKYEDNVSRDEKKARRQRMNTLLREVSEKNNQSELWTKRLMMINKIEDSFFSGYSDNFKTVVVQKKPWVSYDHISLWDFVNVVITHTESLKIFGEIVV
jgi:tRNA A37 methylthiotransferase MiaB